MSITYGIDVKSDDDQFLSASVDAGLALVAAMVPGKFLADTVPVCAYLCTRAVACKHLTNPSIVRYVPDWFPGAGFKALAKEVHDKSRIAAVGPFEYVKKAIQVRSQSSLRSDCVFNLRVTISPARGVPGP